jgi:hypothetical protein
VAFLLKQVSLVSEPERLYLTFIFNFFLYRDDGALEQLGAFIFTHELALDEVSLPLEIGSKHGFLKGYG